MRRIAAVLAPVLLLAMCCPTVLASDREYTIEELRMTLTLPESYHVFSTQTMNDSFWQDPDEPLWEGDGGSAAYMQQLKERNIYLLAAETDSDTSITVAAMATTAIDYRDLLEPETFLLNPANNILILRDDPEATISREVISTTQAPFYVERFWNAQADSHEAMACVTVVNGMEYGIAMQSSGTALTEAQVQTFRSIVESVWFTDLPELEPTPITQEYRIEELGMTITLPEQYHVITSQGISDATLTQHLDDPAAFMQALMDSGIFLGAYASDYSSSIIVTISATDYEDFRTQLDRALLDTENDFTELGFKTIQSRELIQTPQAPFLAVRFEAEDGRSGFGSFTIIDGVCFAVMATPTVDNPLTKSLIQDISGMTESIRFDGVRDVIRPSDTVVFALELAILVLLLPVPALIYRLLIKKRPISRKRTVLVVLLQGAITGGAFALARLVIPNIVQEPLFDTASLVCMAAAFVIYSRGYRAPEKEQPQSATT